MYYACFLFQFFATRTAGINDLNNYTQTLFSPWGKNIDISVFTSTKNNRHGGLDIFHLLVAIFSPMGKCIDITVVTTIVNNRHTEQNFFQLLVVIFSPWERPKRRQ
jgi:hypothetical protein